MSIIISIGKKWGGVYWYRGLSCRLCLGWVAITILPVDDDILLGEDILPTGERESLTPLD